MLKNRNLKPEQVRDLSNMIYRAKRQGLNASQQAIWRALAQWFNQNPEPPRLQDIAQLSGYSRSSIWWALPVLEDLGYVRVNRTHKGRIVRKGIVLLVWPQNMQTEGVSSETQ